MSQAVDRQVRPQFGSSNAIITSARLQEPSRFKLVRDCDGPTTRLPAQWLVECGPMGMTSVSFKQFHFGDEWGIVEKELRRRADDSSSSDPLVL